MKTYTLLLCVVCSSCGLYRQNVVNTPLFEHKGQLQVAGYLSFNGPEVQMGYSLSNHLGVVANYRKVDRKTEYSSSNYSNERLDFREIGFGFYNTKKTEVTRKTFEVFLLAANGFSSKQVYAYDNILHQTTIQIRESKYNRFGIQLDIGQTVRKFSMCASPRLIVVHYYHLGESNIGDLSPKLFLRADLAFTLRYAISKNILFNIQPTLTIPVSEAIRGNTKASNIYDDYSPFNCSVGIIFNFNLFKKSNKQS